jgi:hypothetical protein
MIKILYEKKMVEKYSDDPVSGGFIARINSRWVSIEKEVSYNAVYSNWLFALPCYQFLKTGRILTQFLPQGISLPNLPHIPFQDVFKMAEHNKALLSQLRQIEETVFEEI